MGLIKLIKNYRQLGHEEFMRKWKNGIDAASPLQQLNGQLLFIKITLVGIVLGFAASIWKWESTWWLAIILFGTAGTTWMQFKSLKKQRDTIQNLELMVEQQMKGGEIQDDKQNINN